MTYITLHYSFKTKRIGFKPAVSEWLEFTSQLIVKNYNIQRTLIWTKPLMNRVQTNSIYLTIVCNIINVLTINFNQFNAPLLNKGEDFTEIINY